MILIFDENEALQAVLSNDGAACPYYGAIHDEKINLENTFTLTIPADHNDAQYVIEGSLVAFQDLDSNWQLFEVKRIVDTDDTATIKQAYCDHAYYELLGDIVPSGGVTGASAWLAVTSALSESRWEVGNVTNLGNQTTAFSYQTALGCLQQVATTWQGELQFRVTVANNVITHRYVDLVARRGNTTSKQFVFGKDLLKVERDVDFNNVYTAMYGRGKGTIDNARLNFSETVWTTPTNPANKPSGQEWIGDTAALAQYGLAGGTRHRFGIFDDSQESDPAVLLQKTWDALQLIKAPVASYEFDAISMEQISPDYSHEAVRIGDITVSLDENFSPALKLMIRVIGVKRNLLEPDKTRFTLGSFKQDLASSQYFQNQINRRVQDNSGIWDNASALVPSVLGPAIYDLTSELRSAGGYVVFSDTDGIMIYNTPDPTTATKAMKLGGGIFGIADSKDPVIGAWNWRTFGDGGGFTADLITAGKISADKVQIGTGVNVLGSSTFYWDTSGLYAVNGSNVTRITSTGISIGTAGVGGAFSTAITGAGIVASAIKSGTLDCSLITVTNLNAGSITSGTISGDRISGGTINGVTITGATITASNNMEIQSNTPTGTIETGLYFGNTVSGYGAKSSIKGYQYADGLTYLKIQATTFVQVIAENRIDLMHANGSGCAVTAGTITASGTITAPNFSGTASYATSAGYASSAGSAAGVDAGGNDAVLKSVNGSYVLVNSSYMRAVIGGSVRFQVNSDGTKSGGTIELNGKNWGMSPVDSPRMLISDLIIDQAITPEGVMVQLDSKLAQAVSGYVIFPSRSDVIVSDKQPGSFRVSGTGTVDLYILGTRVGKESVYWTEMEVPILEEGEE